jgi:hypothetical protein
VAAVWNDQTLENAPGPSVFHPRTRQKYAALYSRVATVHAVSVIPVFTNTVESKGESVAIWISYVCANRDRYQRKVWTGSNDVLPLPGPIWSGAMGGASLVVNLWINEYAPCPSASVALTLQKYVVYGSRPARSAVVTVRAES